MTANQENAPTRQRGGPLPVPLASLIAITGLVWTTLTMIFVYVSWGAQATRDYHVLIVLLGILMILIGGFGLLLGTRDIIRRCRGDRPAQS